MRSFASQPFEKGLSPNLDNSGIPDGSTGKTAPNAVNTIGGMVKTPDTPAHTPLPWAIKHDWGFEAVQIVKVSKSRAEDIGRQCLMALGCTAVDVNRPLERLFARIDTGGHNAD